MDNTEFIEILNELLGLESRGALTRLGESGVFVSWASAHDRRSLEKMIAESREHRAWLVDAIHRLGGEPVPAAPDIRSCDMHYLDLKYLLPRTVELIRRTVDTYAAASAYIGGNPVASDVVNRITERRQKQLELLTGFQRRLEPAPA